MRVGLPFLFLALSGVLGHALLEGTSMNKLEVEVFQEVARTCRADVINRCDGDLPAATKALLATTRLAKTNESELEPSSRLLPEDEIQNQQEQQEEEVFLPFDSHENQCLAKIFRGGWVSKPCANALEQLAAVRSQQAGLPECLGPVEILIHTYLGAFFAVLVLFILAVAGRRHKLNGKELNRVRSNILRAIYSRPALKAAVEKELGESIGYAPPYEQSRYRLTKKQKDQPVGQPWWSTVFFFILRFVVCFSLISAFLHSTHFGLFLLSVYFVLFTFGMFAMAAFGSRPSTEEESTCCCCGASTKDAAAGNRKSCKCCRGTGVCSVQCYEGRAVVPENGADQTNDPRRGSGEPAMAKETEQAALHEDAIKDGSKEDDPKPHGAKTDVTS